MDRNSIQKKIDKVLLFLILTSLMVILISQALLLIPSLGSSLNMALKLEGVPLNTPELLEAASQIPQTPWSVLSLNLLNMTSRPDVKVFLNGDEVGTFLQSEVALKVKNGDVISIHNPDHKLPVHIIVNKKTPNIEKPLIGSEVKGSGLLQLPAVVMK